MTFDHFDTQVSHEETQACQDWNGYLEMLNSFDNETKAELNEVDMQCEKAEAEAISGTMAQLDRGPTNFTREEN